MPRFSPGWQPKSFRRFVRNFKSSTLVTRIETDVGEGFVKVVGNPAGPHALACEWVGTQLADLLSLSTFDYALLEIGSDDEIPLFDGSGASPGQKERSRRPGRRAQGTGDDDADSAQLPQCSVLQGREGRAVHAVGCRRASDKAKVGGER